MITSSFVMHQLSLREHAKHVSVYGVGRWYAWTYKHHGDMWMECIINIWYLNMLLQVSLSNECHVDWSSCTISAILHASKQTHCCYDMIIMCRWYNLMHTSLQKCNYINYNLFTLSLCHANMSVWYGGPLHFMSLSMHCSWHQCWYSPLHHTYMDAKSDFTPFYNHVKYTSSCYCYVHISFLHYKYYRWVLRWASCM